MSTAPLTARARAVIELTLVIVLFALVLPATAWADDPAGEPEPVPSIDPDWSASFVPPPAVQSRLRVAAACLPVDVAFYAQTDWLRLAQMMRKDPSACAEYYVSVPPNTSDKTVLRTGQAKPIRDLGPQFHAMAEIHFTGWSGWVAADGTRTWFDAGVEARRRMASAGFDVNAGDIWAVNEFPSSVRTGAGAARQNVREFVRGLYTGDGTVPVRGLVWVAGISQATTFLDVYKANVKSWLGDDPFFADLDRYVRLFSQEVYADVSKWAVDGTTPQDRLGPLADYLDHFGTLAGHAPEDYGATLTYLAQSDAPIGTAAWPRPAYGWGPATDPTAYTVAKDFISAQVHAFRHQQASRERQTWGFAWNPANFTQATDHVPPIPDFAFKTGDILTRLAASIHASERPTEDPGIAACSGDLSWCDDSLDGASFNPAWHVFNTWSQPVASNSAVTAQENTATEIVLNASDADGDPLTYAIVSPPLNGTLAGSGRNLTYTPSRDYSGPDSFTFRVNDGVMDSRTATVSIAVNAPPTVSVDAVGPINEGAPPVTLAAHAFDPEGVAVTFNWSADLGTLEPGGDTATFRADDGPATATVSVTADDGNGGTTTAAIEVVVRNVPPTSDAGPDVNTVWGVPVTLSGNAADPSVADTKAGLSSTWTFGDGSSADGSEASHVYAEPGAYAATLTVRDKDGGETSASKTVTIGPRSGTLTGITPGTIDAASAVVGARFGDGRDASSARLAGRPVTLAVGEATCSATTDDSGIARCTLAASSLPFGPATVNARFEGDGLYEPASTSAPVLVYGLPHGGAFAVGDRSASGPVTFWGPSWWLANALTAGPAPASFKGFVQPTASGWTAAPGFDGAPATVPAWMGVVVTKFVTKDGAVITGDGTRMVVVHVDTYDAVVGGRGTVVADAS